jgi:two-component sensor histidine kinase
LGIIINELLTNAMKYAFKGRSGGTIRLKAVRVGNRVSLELRDNGNTIPASIDFKKSTGFGLMLVASLTDQLHGSIRIERNEGTGIILDFDADPIQ